jgi:tetratricopeptide (TPR) repeat protein
MVRGARPSFAWSASDSTAELRLKLYDERGVRWQRDVKGPRAIRYPDDADPLVDGIAYSWTLETTDPLRFPPLRTQAAFFEVMPADEAKRVEAAVGAVDRASIPSEAAYRVVLASIYFEHRLLGDAIAETVNAIEIDPGNGDLHAILARLYAETGRSEEAMSEYDKLLDTR